MGILPFVHSLIPALCAEDYLAPLHLNQPLLREALLTTHPKEKDLAWGVHDCSSPAPHNARFTVPAQKTRTEVQNHEEDSKNTLPTLIPLPPG